MNIVALLDSMWGWGGYNEAGEEAPKYFRINPNNHSGRRLYRICGDHRLLVTNCCRFVQCSANHHGVPDPTWVRGNLEFLAGQQMDLLLVCGRISQGTFAKIFPLGLLSLKIPGTNGFFTLANRPIRYIFMDHPAARRWSNVSIDSAAAQVAAVALTIP